MKKIFKTVSALVALTACLTFTFGLAACTDPEEPEHTTHVDENTDGVCDVCGEEMETEEPTEAAITDGRWETVENTPDRDNAGAHFKLKEDGTFYMYSAWVDTMGTWELLDEEKTYYEINQGDPYAADMADEIEGLEEKTAAQTLVLTAYDGAVYEGAYADDHVWNMQRPTLQGISYESFVQDAEYEWSEDTDEVPIVDYTLCLPKDGSKTITIDASMTDEGTMYDNLGDTGIRGTYSKEEAADGTITYTLKNASGSEYATLVVSGETYTYTVSGEEPIALVTEAWEAEFTLTTQNGDAVSVTFAGETSADDVLVQLNLWEDRSADVVLTSMTTFKSTTVLSGTYAQGENGELVLTFGETTFTSSAPDAENNVSVELTLPAGDVLAQEVKVTVLGEFALVYVTGSFVAENVQVTGISGMEDTPAAGTLSLDMYNDGTAVLNLSISVFGMSATAVVDTGTYTMDTSAMIPAITFTFETAGEVAAVVDYTSATPTGISLDVTYTAEAQTVNINTGIGDPIPMTLTFTGTMRWTYSIA